MPISGDAKELPTLESWELEELKDPDAEAVAVLQGTHRGFGITCERCGSSAVGVESDFGCSPTSGTWGGVALHCARCDLAVYVWEVY